MASKNFILELILRAKDDASTKIKGILGSLGGLGSGVSGLKDRFMQATQPVENFYKSLSEVAVRAGMIVGPLAGVAYAIKKNVDATVEHIRSNYELSLTMGTTVEEASRLAELADDNRISMEQLGTAMALARKNGFEPSIENLANLADELQGMSSNTEKATKLNEIFGRGWKTLLPLVSKSGDEIRDEARAINENLIVTSNMVQQEEAYRLAVDNATDAIHAQQYALGNELLPLLTQILVPAQTEVINGQAFLVKQIGDTTQAWIRQGNVLVDATGKYALLKGMSSEARMEAQKGYDTKPLEELEGAAGDAATEIHNVAVAIEEVTTKKIAEEAIAAVNKAFEEGKIPEDEYKDLLGQIAQHFDGVIPAAQVSASLALADLKKSFEENDTPISNQIKLLDTFDRTLRGLPRDINITVTTTYIEKGSPSGGGGGGGARKGKQHGGPVKKGEMYPVGEGGPELFVPDQNGQIVPNDKAFGRGGSVLAGGNTYILNQYIMVPAGASAEAIASLAAAKVLRVYSRGGAGSWQYAE